MMIIKIICYYIYFYCTNCILLEYTPITNNLDVFSSFTGTNALLLHLSIYICIQILILLFYVTRINSEIVVRTSISKMMIFFIKKSVENILIFLLSLYFVNSLFVVKYLGFQYFISSHIIIPIIISIIIYTLLYFIIEMLFLICYLIMIKAISSLIIIISFSLISTFVFRDFYGNLSFFEDYYAGGIIVTKVITILILLFIIAYLLLNILHSLLMKKDFIYEV